MKIDIKTRDEMIKVCEENKDKHSAMSIGRYLKRNLLGESEEWQFEVLCVKVVKGTNLNLVRQDLPVENNNEIGDEK